MTTTIAPHWENQAQQLVQSGSYSSIRQVFDEALFDFFDKKQAKEVENDKVRKLLQVSYDSGRVKPKTTEELIAMSKKKYNRC